MMFDSGARNVSFNWLDMGGLPLPAPTRSLLAGWNLIGTSPPSGVMSDSADDLLLSLRVPDQSYTQVYDPNADEVHITDSGGLLTPSLTMYLGNAYWIYMEMAETLAGNFWA